MTRETHLSRRMALRLCGVGLAVCTAGCLDDVPFLSESENALNSIPEEGTEAVGQVEMDNIQSSDEFRTVIETYLQQLAANPSYSGPQNFDDALGTPQERYGLALKDITELTAFGRSGTALVAGGVPPLAQSDDNNRYMGTILSADFDSMTLISTIEQQGPALTKETYKDTTVYRSASGTVAIALLSDTEYAIGTEQAVKNVVAVTKGDKRSLKGDIRTAFTTLSDGAISGVGTVHAPNPSSAPQALAHINYVSGVIYHDEIMYVAFKFMTDNENAATEVKNFIDDNLSEMKEKATSQFAKESLDSIILYRDGSTVSISSGMSTDQWVKLIQLDGGALAHVLAGTKPNDSAGVLPTRMWRARRWLFTVMGE